MTSLFNARRRSQHRHERTFAIIEPWLERHLVGVLAVQRIGEPMYVEHYRDYNLPIEVDIPASIEIVSKRDSNSVDGYRAAEPALSYFGRAARGTLRNQAA